MLNVPNGREPLKQFLLHIIFNAALWIKAEKVVSHISVKMNTCAHVFIHCQVQLYLYTHIALHYGAELTGDSGWDLKEFITVQHLLYIIRKYYSYLQDNNADESHNNLCNEVRPYLILTIKQFVTRVSSILYIYT